MIRWRVQSDGQVVHHTNFNVTTEIFPESDAPRSQ